MTVKKRFTKNLLCLLLGLWTDKSHPLELSVNIPDKQSPYSWCANWPFWMSSISWHSNFLMPGIKLEHHRTWWKTPKYLLKIHPLSLHSSSFPCCGIWWCPCPAVNVHTEQKAIISQGHIETDNTNNHWLSYSNIICMFWVWDRKPTQAWREHANHAERSLAGVWSEKYFAERWQLSYLHHQPSEVQHFLKSNFHNIWQCSVR